MKFLNLSSTASVLVLSTVAGSAFSETKKKPAIEEIVVSASPLATSLSDNANPISVLNGDELRAKAATTIAETLKDELGFASTSFGPSVGNPVIRGQSGPRVKVLQDNLDTLDVSVTSVDHANSTEPLLADQIEILRGPATLRFGNGAIGGVVNVIDNRIPRAPIEEAITGAIEYRHDTSNDEDAGVFRLDGGVDDFAWHVDGVYRESNNLNIPGFANPEDPADSTRGYVDNTQSRAHSYNVGGSWFGESGMLGMSVSRLENLYGIPPGSHDHGHGGGGGDEEEISLDVEQTRIDLKGEFYEPMEGFDKLSVRLAHNDYEHSELEGAEVGTTYKNDAYEGRIELTHSLFGDNKGAFGFQFQSRELDVIGDEAFIPNADIESYGIFFVQETQLSDNSDRWLDWGLRLERQTIDPENSQSSESHTTTSASLAYNWKPSDDHKFTLSYSLAERAPTVEELFSDGAHIATQSIEVGDTSLEEERSSNLDFGYEFTPVADGLIASAKANIFYNRVSDYIYAFNTGVEDPAEELDIFNWIQEDARIYGVELETVFSLADNLNLRVFGDSVRARLDNGGDVPRTTPTRFGSELSFSKDQFDASISWMKGLRQNRPGDNEEQTDDYRRLDAELKWRATWSPSTLIFVQANNLTDEDIRNATSYLRESSPEAGRSFVTGFRVSF